ncbi:MAG: DNA polymerase beta superfamily protein, partial [Floccifex sp.]
MKEIMDRLLKVKSIKVLFVCETGSYSYGLQNQSSNHNIRFIYVQDSVNGYLNLFAQKEEMEFKEDNMEWIGWDLKKVLRSMTKSPISLYEWLVSSYIYFIDDSFHLIRSFLLEKGFSLRSLALSYVSMARNNYKKIAGKENIGTKACIDVLRPLLMAKWMVEKKELPPVSFEALLDLKTSIDAKLEKIIVLRKNNIHQVPFTSDVKQFMEKELDSSMKKIVQWKEDEQISEDILNQLFQNVVNANQWHRMSECLPSQGSDVLLLMKANQKNQYYYAKAFVLGQNRY